MKTNEHDGQYHQPLHMKVLGFALCAVDAALFSMDVWAAKNGAGSMAYVAAGIMVACFGWTGRTLIKYW